MGYHLAGFSEIVGVDINPMPRYPFTFVQARAMDYLANHGHEFDAIHASPPCQGYSKTHHMPWVKPVERGIDPVRKMLQQLKKPYVIENVIGADLLNPVMLCGLTFGLKVFRHRLFESNIYMLAPHHMNHLDLEIGKDGYCCVAGCGDAGRGKHINAAHRRLSTWSQAMGIDWMTKKELTQAIPPAYTEYIGRFLLEAVNAK